MLAQALHQLVELVAGGFRAAGREGAPGGGGRPAEVEELVQGRRRGAVRAHPQEGRGPGFARRGVVRPRQRVDVAVEDHGPDLVGEQVGVGGAQDGPVGDAEVIELRLAHRPAEQVEVLGGVGGRHVAQEVGVALLAAAAQVLVRVDPGRALLGAHREAGRFVRAPGLGLLGGVEAVHGGAVADAPGVPADDVEPFAQVLGEGVVVLRHLYGPGAAGTSGVDEQRAHALRGVAGLAADDGQVDGATGGSRVVQRHLGRGAVVRAAGFAGAPVQPGDGLRGRGRGFRPRRGEVRRDEHRGTDHRHGEGCRAAAATDHRSEYGSRSSCGSRSRSGHAAPSSGTSGAWCGDRCRRIGTRHRRMNQPNLCSRVRASRAAGSQPAASAGGGSTARALFSAPC